MEKLRYTQKIKNQDRLIIRNIILVICLIAFLAILIGSIACIGNGNYFDLIIYGVALIVIIMIQFSTLFICYELIIQYDDGILRITKTFGAVKKVLLDCDCKKIDVEKYSDKIDYGKIIVLSPKSCVSNRYVLKLSGRKFLLNLDDYMYSLIEVAHDIS